MKDETDLLEEKLLEDLSEIMASIGRLMLTRKIMMPITESIAYQKLNLAITEFFRDISKERLK